MAIILSKKSFVSIPLVFALSGCAVLSDNLGKIGGTTVGAGAGAVVGKQIGGDTGLIIGALVGGAAGYFIGDYIDKRRAEQKKIAEERGMKVEFEDVALSGSDSNSTKQAIDRVTIAMDKNQFSSGKSALNPKAKDDYTALAKTYAGTERKILVVGHTDDSGASKTNQKLSEERAKSVGQVLAENGVKKQNIYYWGAGEAQPIADNNTIDGRAKNRRVQIIEIDDEKDIVRYTQAVSANPAYFTKVESKVTTQTKKSTPKASETKVADAATPKTSKAEPKVADTTATAPKKEKVAASIKKEELAATAAIRPSDVAVDFGGKVTRDPLFKLSDEYGGERQGFSLVTKAHASAQLRNCAYDEYHEEGGVKSLSTGKSLPKTSEYRKALNGAAWQGMAKNNLVGIAPVSVLRDGGKAAANPKIFVYKNYITASGAKADFKFETRVNTYEGEKGLLYRVFATDKKSPIKCADIVFGNENSASAKGYMYYVAKNGALLEKEIEIEPLNLKKGK